MILLEGDTAQDEFCINRDDSGKCVTCIVTFLNKDNVCTRPQIPISHCLSYETDTACQSCQFNFSLNNEKQCPKNSIKNCLREKDGKCLICKTGQLVVDGKCEDESAKCTTANCDYCFKSDKPKNDICFLCAMDHVLRITKDDQGFYVSSCIKKTDANEHCYRLQQTNDKCQVCFINYYMNTSGACVKSTKYETNLFGYEMILLIQAFMLWALY